MVNICTLNGFDVFVNDAKIVEIRISCKLHDATDKINILLVGMLYDRDTSI